MHDDDVCVCALMVLLFPPPKQRPTPAETKMTHTFNCKSESLECWRSVARPPPVARATAVVSPLNRCAKEYQKSRTFLICLFFSPSLKKTPKLIGTAELMRTMSNASYMSPRNDMRLRFADTEPRLGGDTVVFVLRHGHSSPQHFFFFASHNRRFEADTSRLSSLLGTSHRVAFDRTLSDTYSQLYSSYL